LASKSKEQIASILRELGIKTITFKHTDAATKQTVDATVEVPGEGIAWEIGFPTADELRAGAFNAILKQKPELVRPPYEMLLDPTTDLPVWNGHKIVIKRTPPYTPKWWPIELKWADGKNWVAAPGQQWEGRSSAEVVKLMRDRWYRGPTTGERLFRHCEKEMSKFLQENKSNEFWNKRQIGRREGARAMIGTVEDGQVRSIPDAQELRRWKQWAGMADEESADLPGDILDEIANHGDDCYFGGDDRMDEEEDAVQGF
jgi:hypothetical protein